MKNHLNILNNKNRLIDNFYAEFFRMPAPTGNMLGRQLRSLTRPTISFTVDTQRQKGFTYKNKGDVNISGVTLVFHDDEESITSTLLYIQMMKQLNKYDGVFGDDIKLRDYKFDVRVRMYNANKDVTETFTMKNCFITEVNYPENAYENDTESYITVSIEFDNLDIELGDHIADYITFKKDENVFSVP